MARTGRPGSIDRERVWAAWTDADGNGTCALCGTVANRFLPAGDPNGANLAHVVADAEGGTWSADNLILACRACNLEVGTATIRPTWLREGPRPAVGCALATQRMRDRRGAMAAAQRARRAQWGG